MESEFKNFCFAIYEEAYSLFKECQKINPTFNPNIRQLVLFYVDTVKKYSNSKIRLIDKLKSKTPSLGTMKESLRYMVMNDTRTPPHYAKIEQEVSNFIINPESVISFLEKQVVNNK